MDDKIKQKNIDAKTSEPRPPYQWDEELREITEEAKKVIEKEEANAEENRK